MVAPINSDIQFEVWQLLLGGPLNSSLVVHIEATAFPAVMPIHHSGMTSGLFFGNFAMVASLTLRCWATIEGGVRDIQSDSETSAK
jgi:hypothetical protein